MHPLQALRALSVQAFMAPHTLEQRLALAMNVLNRRVFSHDAATAWLDWIGAHGRELTSEQVEQLMREVLLMSPLHPSAPAIYAALMRPSEPLPADGRVVFMVTSCRKYFAQAQRVQADLRARGATACIVIGDPGLRVPHWDGDTCTLPVQDNYESLPLKVAAGVNALVQRFGAIAVVKIDDDCHLTAHFTPERFLQLARAHDYVGMLAVNPHLCRFWHFGKTSRPMGPYSRRHHGAWAGGACYLLGPRAAALVASEYAHYPAEIGDEYYEDKAIGDFMRRQGVPLTTIRHAEWGITFDTTERFVAPVLRDVVTSDETVAAAP